MVFHSLENFIYLQSFILFIPLAKASPLGADLSGPADRPLPSSLGGGCGHPGSLINSKVFLHSPSAVAPSGTSRYPIPVGTTALYSCEEPYIALGETRRICRPDSTWSGASPYCGLNVAMHKPLLYPPHRNAWLTNDGIISTRGKDCFSHTLNMGEPLTWKLDLTETFQVHSIRILALADFPWSANVTLYSTTTASSIVCGRIDYNGVDETAAISVPCLSVHPDVRYVQIDFSISGNGRLRLCEVNILAVDALTSDFCPHEASAKAVMRGSCLSFHSHGRATWGGALQTCRKLGGTLVNNIGTNEQAFLQAKLNYLHRFQPTESFYWLGLFRAVNMSTREDKWQWTLGSSARTFFWAPNQPDSIGMRQYCGGMSGQTSWLWHDLSCESGQGFWICRTNFTTCPIPDQPINGQISMLDRRLGGLVSYQCEEGFQLMGSVSRSCLSSGTWSGSLPQCITSWDTTTSVTPAATTPLLLDNATQSTLAPSTVGLTTVLLEEEETVQEGLGFSATDAVSGSSSGNPTTATFTTTNVPSETLAEFTTDHNNIRTSFSAVSVEVATANSNLPETAMIQTLATDATVAISDSTTLFETHSPSTSGFKDITSQPKSQTTDLASEKSKKTVDDQPAGDAAASSSIPHISRVFIPNLSPDSSPHSLPFLNFAAARCRPAPMLFNGKHTLDTIGTTVIAKYTCNQGFNLVGIPLLTCTADGFWRGMMPLCIPAYVPKPTEETTRIPSTPQATSTEVTTGFSMTGPPSVTDSPAVFTVERSTENAFSQYPVSSTAAPFETIPPGAKITSKAVPSTLRIKDPASTKFSFDIEKRTTQKTTRLPNAAENNVVPVEMGSRRCPPLPLVQHAETLFYRDLIIFRCFPGYFMVGNNETRCLQGGIWEKPPECLPVDCGLPEKLSSGVAILLNGSSSFGSLAAYSCNDQNPTQGLQYRSCGEDGRWEGTVPECPVDFPVVLSAESRQQGDQGSKIWSTIVFGVVGTVGGILVVLAAVFSFRWLQRRRKSAPVAISPTMYSITSASSPSNLMTERSSARLFNRAHYMPSSASSTSPYDSAQSGSLSDVSTQTGRFNSI